jgi:transaldolase
MMKSTDRVPRLQELNIKIFSDGADLDSIIEAYNKGIVKGFTTNPTLMAKAGITNYLMFAEEVLRVVRRLPVSFEVFSDDFDEMREQALRLAALADNVYVKIPVTNTERKSGAPLIKDLSHRGLKLNVTAILSLSQVKEVAAALNPKVPAIVSVFAGRIADSGRDPLPIMIASRKILNLCPRPNCFGPARAKR